MYPTIKTLKIERDGDALHLLYTTESDATERGLCIKEKEQIDRLAAQLRFMRPPRAE